VHALVVTDLYVDMARNETDKYQLTLQRLDAAAGNTKGIAALERILATLFTGFQWSTAQCSTN
jgi:hypothetical protein